MFTIHAPDMKVATFNCNSIRKRMPIVLDWLKFNRPDVLCLQETKVIDADFPIEPLSQAGYYVTFRGMKGYNGVATLTRSKPDKIGYGFCEGPDSEDFRMISTEVSGITIINTYIPQGASIDSPKYQYKLQWFKRLQQYFDEHLNSTSLALWVGDMNVAPRPLDVHSPDKHLNHPCYHEQARQAYEQTVKKRFIDVFRLHYPDRVQYTFWDFFANSFATNKGWRIDHILATPSLAPRCELIEVDLIPRRAPNPSDHTVVWAQFT